MGDRGRCGPYLRDEVLQDLSGRVLLNAFRHSGGQKTSRLRISYPWGVALTAYVVKDDGRAAIDPLDSEFGTPRAIGGPRWNASASAAERIGARLTPAESPREPAYGRSKLTLPARVAFSDRAFGPIRQFFNGVFLGRRQDQRDFKP
jgi:hypothetical protein